MKSVKYTLDRFEGSLAVLLQRSDEEIEKILPRSILGSVSEGDILTITYKCGIITYVELHKEETIEARRKAQELLNKLNNR